MDKLPYRPCVGVMLCNKQGLIFAGERIDTPGAWQMPQGGIDKGEDPEAAALRELGEEIGVQPTDVKIEKRTEDWITYDLPDHLLGRMWGGRFGGQKQIWFLMTLTAGDRAINIETAHPEFRAWRWSTSTALLQDIVPFKRKVYAAVVADLLG